jgi:hypothetical protein
VRGGRRRRAFLQGLGCRLRDDHDDVAAGGCGAALAGREQRALDAAAAVRGRPRGARELRDVVGDAQAGRRGPAALDGAETGAPSPARS